MPLSSVGNADLYTMMEYCGLASDPRMPPQLPYAYGVLQVEGRNGISYLQPQYARSQKITDCRYGIREFTYEPGHRTFYTNSTWNSPKHVWEYAAQVAWGNPPSPASLSSAISSSTATSTPISGGITSTQSPPITISTSTVVLTKTIVETICSGGSVIFETKTYSGEYCETYIGRPSYAKYVEVDCPAWPAPTYNPLAYGSGSSYSSGSLDSQSGPSGVQSNELGWYFDSSGNQVYGYIDNGYDIVVIEQYNYSLMLLLTLGILFGLKNV